MILHADRLAVSGMSGPWFPMSPIPDSDMPQAPQDDPYDPRNFAVGGPAGGHPVHPHEPFASLPVELHDHARHLMHMGHSAEEACRQVYGN